MFSKLFLAVCLIHICKGHNSTSSGSTNSTVTIPQDSEIKAAGDQLEPDLITSRNPEGLFEGDLVIQGTQLPDYYGNGVLGERFRWKGGLVPAEIDQAFSQSEKQKIYQGMQLITSKTCIRFKRRDKERDYIHIRRGRSGSGCVCYGVGKQGGPQTINLAEDGCIHPGVAAHEMLHAIGMHHEQTRGDRDKYVKIYYDNIMPSLVHNFNKITEGTMTYGNYDYGSIMHYPGNAFSKNGKRTMVSIDNPNRPLGTYEKLSDIDVYTVQKMYGDCKL